MTAQEENATAEGLREGADFVIRLAGRWTVRRAVPDWALLLPQWKAETGLKAVRFDVAGVTHFDSILVSFLLQVSEAAEADELAVELADLPTELRRLMELARKVPEKTDAARRKTPGGFFAQVGEGTVELVREGTEILAFVGEGVGALGRLFIGRARMRWKDFWTVLESVSVQALPIVALISFLVGVIISFLGAVTLKQFGAEFAVSYLVGYGMLREMGAVMTGIIMAGRTGAAFAAQIGSMKVNEEIDALRTFGIAPMEFLVVPRLLALVIMMPVLTVYANIIGIASGWLVAEFMMGVPGPVFFLEMSRVIGTGDFVLGLVKAVVFGLLIGGAGCLRGLQCGAGADAVGKAATRAVVSGITLIIFANAVIDWIAALLDV